MSFWSEFRRVDRELSGKVRTKTQDGDIVIFKALLLRRGWGVFFTILSAVLLVLAAWSYFTMDYHFHVENLSPVTIENPLYGACPRTIEKEAGYICDLPTFPPGFSAGSRAGFFLENIAALVVAGFGISLLLFGRIVTNEDEGEEE